MIVRSLCVLLLAVFSVLVDATTPTVCRSSQWQLVNGRCYLYQSTPLEWNDARPSCTSLDTSDATLRIADPRNLVENDYVRGLCATNGYPWPSPWHLWDSGTFTTTAINNIAPSNADWRWKYPTDTDNNPAAPRPQYNCMCTPPASNSNYQNWCMDVRSSVAVPRIGTQFGIAAADVRPCVATSGNSGGNIYTCATTPAVPSGFTRYLCRPPAVLRNSTFAVGQGTCWLGGSRSSSQSDGTLVWNVAVTEASQTIGYDLLEPTLLARNAVGTQSAYVKLFHKGYGTIAGTPNCIAMWDWSQSGTWVMDWCNKKLPYVCVADARCPAGYRKSQRYSVLANSTITSIGQCQVCPDGTYRSLTDAENSCLNCPPGFFGSGPSLRTNSTCNGVCPAGTYCPGATVTPFPCPVGTYGLAVTNSVNGPGWDSAETGCLECPAGSYCDTPGLTFANIKPCPAGTCSTPSSNSPFCTQLCPPGYFCPGGSACNGQLCGSSASPSGAAAYCPSGVSAPKTVPAGYYGIGNSTMRQEDVLACPPGFFCDQGVRTPCPLGTYLNSDTDVDKRNVCKPCNNGYFCPGPTSPTTPSSTSPTQQFCANSSDSFPAQNYCVNGVRFRISDTNSTVMTVPANGPLNIREGVIPCPQDKVCAHGLPNDRVSWTACPNGAVTVSVPELLSVADTGVDVNATLFSTLLPQDWTLDYRILNQAFANPSLLANAVTAPCRAGVTVNDGIFAVNSSTGRLLVNRFAPNPFNPAGALQFEVCEPITDVRYTLTLQASLRQKVGSIQANITCAVTVQVLDRNDQPIFPATVHHRVISESAVENTAAGRCNGDLSTTGCPDDANFAVDPAVAATDEDSFNQGNLVYSFVGPLTAAQDKLKINSCTGLISQQGGAQNVLRFSDPSIPTYNGIYKRLNYTILVEDDGNANPANVRSSTTLVYVYIRNINDRPVILTPATTDFWVPESTSSRRFRFPRQVTPNTLSTFDDDQFDNVTLSIVRNDASAFEMVNGILQTTDNGETGIDFESARKTYTIDIEARDDGRPSLASQITITIRVANMNDPPVIEGNLVFYIPESAGAGQPVCRDDSGICTVPNPLHAIKSEDQDNIPTDKTTYNLTVNPGGLFQINSTSGQVSLVASNSLNFENESLSVLAGTGRAYTLQVMAKSDGVGVVTQPGLPTFEETSVKNFVVYIVDVNEPPIFTTPNLTAFRMVETWPVGSVVSTIDIRASDPDNADVLLFGVAAPRQLLSFSLSATSSGAADGAAFFAVSTDLVDNSRARILLRSPIDFEAAPVCSGGTRCYTLRVVVADNGGPIQGVAERIYRIDIVDVNEAPVFTQASYSITAREDLNYASQVDLVSGVPLKATDADIGGDALLTYALTAGDGLAEFSIASLGAGNGFNVRKRTNALLNFEVKNSYTLRVEVTDNRVGSSAIGKTCTLDQGISFGCGNGAFCQNSQCYEICPTYQNATTTIQPSQVPRVDVFFCQSLTGINGLAPITPLFYEKAEATLIIVLSDENDQPFIIDRPSTVPQPNMLTNANCSLSGVMTLGLVDDRDQFPFSAINVWDDDTPNPGVRAGPFVFLPVISGTFWNSFTITNNVTGRVGFPRCLTCNTLFSGQIFSGSILVRDRTGLNSTCNLVVTILDENLPPFLGSDFAVAPVSELALADYLVFKGYNQTEIEFIDPDTTNVANRDHLTFSTTFSLFFDINENTSAIILKQSLDYESSAPLFQQTILVRAVDKRGADDVVQVIVPILDVNEAPQWSVGGVSYSLPENATSLTSIANLSTLVSDPDIYATNASWRTTTITIRSGCGASCPVEINNGVLRIKNATTLDFETLPNVWNFVVRATDGGGLFSEIGATFSLTDVNESPRFTATSSVSVPEGPGGPGGRDLLDMSLFVQDPDAADPVSTLSFNITSGNLGGVFEVSSAGLLRVAPNRLLDYESITAYILTLSVQDRSGLSSTGGFIVNVTNINDVTVTAVQVVAGPFAAANQLSCNGTVSKVRITGTNFGLLSNSPPAVATVGFRRGVSVGPASPTFAASGCVVTVSNTVLECNVTTGGAGNNLLWDVSVSVPGTQIAGDAVFTTPSTIAFPLPTVMSLSGTTDMSTAGGQSISITGTCLGRASDGLTFGVSGSDSFVQMCTQFDGICRAMPTGCTATSSLGTTISCDNATLPGLGSSTSFSVRSGRQSSNTQLSGGYGRPTVTSLSNSVLRTRGTIAAPGIRINGTNFGGLNSAPGYVRVFYNASGTFFPYDFAGCTVTIAYTQVTCTSHAEGVGINMRMELSFGGQTNPSSPLLNFESATITSVATDGNALSPTNGGIFVTLTGQSLGPVCGVPGTSIASGAINCPLISASYERGSLNVLGLPIVYRPFFCAVISQTQAVCTTVEGTGRNHTWSLTVGGQPAFVSPNAGLTGYSSPVVGAYSGPGAANALTSGNQYVDLSGAHFGPVGGAAVSAVYGNELHPTEFTAVNCTVTIPHILMRCFTGVGAGDSLGWRVTVDGQASRAQLSDYGPPSISNVTLGGLLATSLSDDGGESVILLGNNFGPPFSTAYLQSVTYGPSTFQNLYTVTSRCTVLSHETIRCTTLPGVGTNLQWRVTVRGQVSNSPGAVTSFRSPILYSISTNTSRTNGGDIISIRGAFFGFCDPNVLVRISFGPLFVEVRSVFRPSSVDPINLPVECAPGLPAAYGSERILTFAVPEMTGTDTVPIRVQVDTSTFSFPTPQIFTFRYGRPEVTDVFAEPGPTLGTILVTLSGINFCRSEACCQTYLDGQLHSASVLVHTHDRITFLSNGPGVAFVRCPGGDTPDQEFSSQNPFVYGVMRASDLTRIDAVTFPTIGGDLIYIFSLFATTSSTVSVGGRPATVVGVDSFQCDSTDVDYRPDTIAGILSIIVPNQVCSRIRVLVPPGQGLNNDVVVAVGALRSRADDFRFEFLAYTAPSATGLSASFASTHPTVGSMTLLTVTGTNFGLSGEILFGPTATFTTRTKIACGPTSPGYNWTHTQVSCFVPPGEGSSLEVRVQTGSQLSPPVASGRLRYTAPAISDFSVVNTADNLADTIGGQTLLVQGSNFGRAYNASAIATSPGQLPSVLIGPSSLPCSILSSNHTEIACSIPPADGRNLALRVIVAGESPGVLSPKLFSYGAPVVWFVSPQTGRTSGLDALGNREVFQIVGKNFGVDQLRVEFITSVGPLVLGVRSARDFKDDFLYPGTNHTSIRVFLPSYFGANLNVSVTVNGQRSNLDGPQFSYAAPVIGNTNTTRNGRFLAVEDVFIDNRAWTTLGFFSNCRPLRATNTSLSITRAYKFLLDIAPGGTYTRRYRFFNVQNYTEITDQTCDESSGRFLGETVQTGTFSDLGEHPKVGCMRLYRDAVATITGAPVDDQLFPSGGYGYYLVSERRDLFLSAPSFDSAETAIASPDRADFDELSATLLNPIPQVLPLVPTSGCYRWESEALYRERVLSEVQNSGDTIPARYCMDPALITVEGENFGSNAIPGALRVYLVDDRGVEYEGSTTSSEGNHEKKCTTEMGCIHQDTLIIFQAPFGSGRGLRVKVVLENQANISLPKVDYYGPNESEMIPGTLNSGAGFLTTSGQEIVRVVGENLGYTTSSLSVLFNGKPCANTTWVTGFAERLGRASIQCQAPTDVPGIKSVFICVGGQGKMVQPIDIVDDVAALQYGMQTGAWNVSGAPNVTAATTVRALAVSRCPPGYYGRIGEKCLPCPQGGRCYPGFDLPIPEATFSLISMAVDSRRALEGSCRIERLDRSQLREFPEMVFYETCEQMVRCVPPESCLDRGVCAPGYEYQLYRCRAIRNSNATDNNCRVFFDSAVGVYRGVNADCQRNTPSNRICSFENPEDCAECRVIFDSPDPSSARGVCECTQPQRCGLCTATTHYRFNNECVKCPDNPALVFSLFILAGVACIALAYYLQKRKINLAFISVGVDYFQVLAVFASTNIAWPPFIRAIFIIFTLFLASIDIAAPECLVPNLEFPTKFYLTELLPILALLILLSIHVAYTFYKMFKLGKQAKWLSHVSRLIGIYILIIYVLYLSLTKRALDVFNCNPLDPDDGYSYTAFSSLSCDGGGLCRCFESGGLQETLVAPAIIFLAIYTFGFPLVVAYIVFSHREEIREDQYLRANRLGDRRETNPRAYDIRKRYQLIYMHFKPKYAYWMLTILLRKFGVAFASLMFRGNPSFQLAVILVVLFISFTFQVSVRPYMSPGEFPVVVKELNENSRKADEDPERYALYRDLFRKVSESMKTQAELLRKEKMTRHKMGAGFWDESRAAAREHDRRSAAEKYFFDLNAVEAVLLGSTIIIALAGIMFESGRFTQSRDDIAWQADLVIVLTFIVLFGSLGYYILVFINELWPVTFARYCGRIFLRYQNDGITNEDMDKIKDNDIVLDANPLFAATGPVGDKSKSLQKEIEASKEALALAKRQNEELKRLKAELESGGGVTARNPLAIRELMNTGI